MSSPRTRPVGSHLPQSSLSASERVRLFLMLAATAILLVMMVLLVSGQLEGVLSALAPGDDGGQLVSEDDDDAGAGGDPDGRRTPLPEGGEAVRRPGALPGMAAPTEVEDPGDDESWRTTKSYLRYREYIGRIRDMSAEELAAEVDPEVRVHSHVWMHPASFKGKVIRLRGLLVRRAPKHDQPEDLPDGVQVNWEVQLFNYGSKHIYTLDLIGDCPAELMFKPVAIDAIFFDVIDYLAKRNVVRRSCFFIGKDITAFELREPSSLWMLIVIGIPIFIVLIFAYLESRKFNRFERDYLRGRVRKQFEASKLRRAESEGGETPPAPPAD